MATAVPAFAPSVRSADAVTPAARPGLVGRIVNAMVAARQRQMDRQIARMIALHGGRITDTLEREIERNFFPH